MITKCIASLVILLCLFTHSVPFPKHKRVVYQDETYTFYQKGRTFWMEIGNPKECKGPPIVYSPTSDSKIWRRRAATKKGFFDADIFFRDLPPPFGLLLPSDMVYIERIIYFPEKKAAVAFFNGPPFHYIRALLKQVKNV